MNNQDIVRVVVICMEAIALFAIQRNHKQAVSNFRGISQVHSCLDDTKAEVQEIKRQLEELLMR